MFCVGRCGDIGNASSHMCRNVELTFACWSVQLLLEAVDSDRVLFNANVADVKAADRAVALEDGSTLKAKVVVGADGVRSAVAAGIGVSPANFTGQAGYRGLAAFDGPSPVQPRTLCQVRERTRVRTCCALCVIVCALHRPKHPNCTTRCAGCVAAYAVSTVSYVPAVGVG